MIKFLDYLSLCSTYIYVFVFFLIIKYLLPLRKNKFMKAAAFLAFIPIANIIIYSNDLTNLLGVLIAFLVYLFVFYSGRAIEKISVLLVFYPAMIAVNYLTQDIGARLFFGITNAPANGPVNPQQILISTLIYLASQLIRLVFWLIAWLLMKRFFRKINLHLTTRMWLFVDVLLLAPFVAIFNIIYFMPENTVIVYPICCASIFSSFGCLYLASYICQSVVLEYRAQELELKHNYYEDRLKEEERVRQIYHDLKNHLLILESNAAKSFDTQKSIQKLQAQIEGYENYYHTGNTYLDVLIRDKARMAQEKQIDFHAVIHFKDGCFIEPLDISTVFGNALDNAIEACEKLPPEKRLITIKADRIRDMLSVRVENTIDGTRHPTLKSTKNDTFSHGFGLSNIKNTVEKYGGQCAVKAVNDTFQLKIILPVLQDSQPRYGV